jgi:hypothetical protein
MLPDSIKSMKIIKGLLLMLQLEGANRPIEISDMNNFVQKYPFMPYQLELPNRYSPTSGHKPGRDSFKRCRKKYVAVTQGFLKCSCNHFKNLCGKDCCFSMSIFDQDQNR